MNILLICANTPYFNEWNNNFIKYLHLSKTDTNITVFCDSDVAKIKYGHMYPDNINFIERQSVPCEYDFEKAEDWESIFISWDRMHHLVDRGISLESASIALAQTEAKLRTLIKKSNIDHVFYEPPASLLGDILWKICNENSIRYWGLMQSRIPERIDVYDQKYRNSACLIDFQSMSPENSTSIDVWQKFSADFVANRIRPTYMDDECNNLDTITFSAYYKKRIKLLNSFFKFLFLRPQSDDLESYMIRSNLLNRIIGEVSARKIRGKKHQRYLGDFTTLTRTGRDFYVFPLHYVPEASVSGQAGAYSDLISTIIYTAFRLPAGSLLAVKEHPSSVGIRKTRFYKDLASIPNIILLDHKVNNQALIEGASGVITLTSTLALEAAITGKPAYIFGDVFFDYHPMCFKVEGYEDLRRQLHNPSKPLEADSLNAANARFWMTYQKQTIPGNVLSPDYHEETFDSLLALVGELS